MVVQQVTLDILPLKVLLLKASDVGLKLTLPSAKLVYNIMML